MIARTQDAADAISEGLATAPERYAPIFELTDDGTVLAGPLVHSWRT